MLISRRKTHQVGILSSFSLSLLLLTSRFSGCSTSNDASDVIAIALHDPNREGDERRVACLRERDEEAARDRPSESEACRRSLFFGRFVSAGIAAVAVIPVRATQLLRQRHVAAHPSVNLPDELAA